MHHVFHFLLQNLLDALGFRLRRFHDQLVVYLQQQPCLQFFIAQTLPDVYHRQLDNVRCRTLNGRVARHTLAPGAHLKIAACQLRQGAAAVKQRSNVAFFLGVGNAALHIAVHLGEGVQIGFQESVRLLDRNPQILAERIRPLAVHNAEVDRLAGAAQLGGDLALGDMVNFGSGGTVDIRAVQKRLLHMLVPRDVRQNAQLDLGVVGVHQRAAGRCHKIPAQAAAQLGADGDVLQVRLAGGNAPGARLGLDKGRVYAPVRRFGRQQPIHIGGEQFCVGAIF